MRRYRGNVVIGVWLGVVSVFAAMPVVASAQNNQEREWVAPRTSEGVPDLQGIWTSQTFTPLQRPEMFDGREYLTDEEMASLTSILTAEDVDCLLYTSDAADE